ncbi:MAG: bacterial Ig-like domain-containing protein, partial [Lachnospiraceae bacterium]|nr:bacterial Ig-like domain-containing protein [Lachnospiraceae bacterium]
MKKIMSVLVTLCLVTGLFMHLGATEEVHAAPATGVSLYSPDGSVKIDLDNGNYYFVDGAAASSGVLGQNNCTAFFDKDTATLTLDGYNYGSITVRDFTNNDLKIILKGTNKITNTSDYAAIYSINGVLEITSDSAGTLEIDVKANMDGVCGIASGYAGGQVDGTVIISGDANLNICVVNESEEYTSFAYGVFARNSIEIKDNASITIKPVTMGTAPDHASGLYLATQGSDPKGISINTLGKVDIDTSGIAGDYSFPILNSEYSSGCNLTKVDTMTLKYKTSLYTSDAYPSFTYDENHFAKRSMDEEGVTTTVYKYGTSHTISIMTGIFNSGLEEVASEISGLENEIVTITAPDLYGLEFKEWVLLSDVEFADNTDVKSNPAKIKVGSSDISIRATYKAFSKEPTFILTGETIGEGNYPVGKIEYTCAKDYDFGIYLISENGYMYGCGGEECEAIYYIDADLKYACCSGLDSDVYYLDPGTYRIAAHEKIVRDGAVKYNIMLFYYSEPFTVSYSKPIKGIKITTVPTKTIYTAGEGFDPTGMEIKVTYEDESFEILSEGFTWSPENAFANNDDKVTISYTLNGETYTTDLAVTVNPSYDVLESIELTTPPTKTNYIEGQSFDPAGMVVTGTYEGGVSKEITGYTIAPSGALTVNDSVITITYILNGKTCTTTQEITVEPKCLESITIITPPTKTKYEIGDRFDKTGMVVTAKWNDDCTEVITAYKCTPEYFESITDTEVTISFTDAFRIGNITKTAKQAVTVKALDSISITTSPDKTVYTHLESFDKTGMVVTAKYSDNSTAEIKDYIIAPAGGLNTTDTSVTISYTEKGITKTAIQAITVNERDDLEEIIILKGPDKTAYVAGEIFAPAGMIVDAVYNNASALISYLYGFDNINGPLTFSSSGALSVDDTIITISYTEGGITKTVTQEITVTAANSGNSGSGNTGNNNSGNSGSENNNSGNNSGSNSGNTNTG